MDGKSIRKSAITGILFEVTTVSSYRYLSIIHEKSGMYITRFTSGPVPGIKACIAIIEKNLAPLNWDVDIEQINDTHKAAVRAITKEISFNSAAGKYEITRS